MKDPPLDKVIRCPDATHCTVDKEGFLATVTDPNWLMRVTRIVPAIEEGKPVGVKLFGIRPTSVLAALGLRNGDVVTSVNDYQLASPEQGLEAYARLRSVDELRVALVRQGTPVLLTIKVVSKKPAPAKP